MTTDACIVVTKEKVYGPWPEVSDAKSWVTHKMKTDSEFPKVQWAIIELNFSSVWSGWSTANVARVIGKTVTRGMDA